MLRCLVYTVLLFRLLDAAAFHASVNVSLGTFVSDPAPHDFASFSVEVQCAPQMIVESLGPAAAAPRASYINLMRNLASESSDRGDCGPNLRIGGNSADRSYFTETNDPLPAEFTVRVTTSDLDAYKYVALWGGSVVVDLSLRNATYPSNVVQWALAAASLLGFVDKGRGSMGGVIDAFEVGNEPELFSRNGIRPPQPPYEFDNYRADFENAVRALVNAGLPMPRIQGAVFCCRRWDSDLVGYIKNNSMPAGDVTDVLTSISQHFYPMAGANATIEKLMHPKAAQLSYFRPFADAAKASGIRMLIGEGNSAYNGGHAGVSDTLAAAIWAIDVMFNSLMNGLTRWNFHGCPGGAYTPIAIDGRHDNGTGGHAAARPLYYGMWFFARATRNGARIVSSNVTCTHLQTGKDDQQRHDQCGGVRFWAALSANAVSLIALHKDASVQTAKEVDATFSLHEIHELVSLPALVKVFRLETNDTTAAALGARSGLRFGGLTFDKSTTGTPSGAPSTEVAWVDTDGRMEVTIRPGSAVLLVLPL